MLIGMIHQLRIERIDILTWEGEKEQLKQLSLCRGKACPFGLTGKSELVCPDACKFGGGDGTMKFFGMLLLCQQKKRKVIHFPRIGEEASKVEGRLC